jgi:putative sigma-54 modulation protein
MQINITGHHVEITNAIREFTKEKFDKLERYCEKVSAINVILSVEKLRHIAEASIVVFKNELHAHAEADDLYAAIDDLIDKLQRQLIKHKEKMHSHRE